MPLILSLAISLSFLSFFKYTDFALETVNSLTGAGLAMLHLVMLGWNLFVWRNQWIGLKATVERLLLERIAGNISEEAICYADGVEACQEVSLSSCAMKSGSS